MPLIYLTRKTLLRGLRRTDGGTQFWVVTVVARFFRRAMQTEPDLAYPIDFIRTLCPRAIT